MGSTPDFCLRSVLFILLRFTSCDFVLFLVFDLLFSMLPVSLDCSFSVYLVYIFNNDVSERFKDVLYWLSWYTVKWEKRETG
jgi:hypothetical protein